MNQLKFLIVLPYYRRPTIVRNALDSLKNQTYINWQLHFIDDSGDDSFKLELEKYNFKSYIYEPTYHSIEYKNSMGGSMHGLFINNAIKNSDADIVIILCDDDALTNNYLNDLNNYYNNHPLVNWSYSHVIPYNPKIDNPFNMTNKDFYLNKHMTPIHPFCQLDASQITYRRSAFLQTKGYEYPRTKALDAHFSNLMVESFGLCVFNFLTGQYKGWFDDQLGNRNDPYNYIG